MANLIEKAKEMWENGYRVIPTTSQKNPAIPFWGQYLKEEMKESDIKKYFRNCAGMALLMGGEEGLIAFDFDLKYDISGTIMQRFYERVGPDIIDKCYIQETRNQGYHLIFSCTSLCKKNRKLAGRNTTAYERHLTYMEHWNDPSLRDKAVNAAYNDKSRVLIETREQGGYVLVPPSEGYTYIQGAIVELTEEEATTMFEAAFSLNEVKNQSEVFRWKDLSEHTRNIKWGSTPTKEFKEKFDFVNFLEEQGWTVVSEGVKDVRLKRPGKGVTSPDSAIYDMESKLFNVYSTSTEFDTQKTYNIVDAVALILFDGDSTEMYNYMLEEGYGN